MKTKRIHLVYYNEGTECISDFYKSLGMKIIQSNRRINPLEGPGGMITLLMNRRHEAQFVVILDERISDREKIRRDFKWLDKDKCYIYNVQLLGNIFDIPSTVPGNCYSIAKYSTPKYQMLLYKLFCEVMEGKVK